MQKYERGLAITITNWIVTDVGLGKKSNNP